MFIHLLSFQNGPLPFSRVDFLVAWVFCELCRLYGYLLVHCTSDVQWRHKKFHLKWGGQLEEVKLKASV